MRAPFVLLAVLVAAGPAAAQERESVEELLERARAEMRETHARLAVELLTRADEARAREIAIYLAEQNRQRQSVERKTRKHAEARW